MKEKYWSKIIRVLLAIMMVISFAGCASKYSGESAASETKMSNEMLKTEAAMDAASTAPQEAEKGEAARGDAPNISTEVTYNRKMIKTGELQLQTKEFKKSVEALVSKVQSLGGYVESSNVQGNNFYNDYANRRSANLTVRIPQKSFDIFINNSSEFGNVVYSTSNSQDITSQYVDTEIRLKSLKTRHERLLKLLEQTGSLKDLFTIEQELGDVTYEIEKLSGALSQYDQLVDMSTINIYIEEVYKIEEVRPVITFMDKIENTFKESVKGLISLLQGLVLILVALLPFMIIVIPLIIVIALMIRKQHRKKAVSVAKKSEEDTQKE